MKRSAHHRPLRGDATALTIGSTTSALAAYGFVALGTRAVGAEAFAPVSVLWSLWAISAAAITFPVQHWIIRTVELTREEGDVRAAAATIWSGALLLGLLVFLGAVWGAERLFLTEGIAFPAMAGCLPAGGVLMGLNRGVLAARSRFRATAVAIAGENVLRVVLAAAFATVVSAEGLGWILVAGFSVAGLYPGTLVSRGRRPASPSPVTLLGGLAGANAAAQMVLTSGPILVSLLGGDGATVTALFAMLAVLRGPHTLLLGITARIMAPLTRLAAEGPDQLRVVERRLIVSTTVLALAGAWLGPRLVPLVTQVVFGIGPEIPVVAVSLLTAGSAVALGGVVEMLILLAEGRGGRLSLAWMSSIAVGAIVLPWPLDPVVKVAAAFAVTEVVALAAMFARRQVVRHPLEEEGTVT